MGGAPFAASWSLWSHPPSRTRPPGPKAVLTVVPCWVTPLLACRSVRRWSSRSTDDPIGRVRPVIRPDGARYDTVCFLSDYGTTDEFVGVVKAVIRDLARTSTVIDLTHEIPPHDVRAGSLALVRASSTCRPASCSPSSIPASARSAGPSRSRSPTARACSSARTTACSRRPSAMAGGAGPGGRADRHRATTCPLRARRSPVATCSRRWPPTSATGSTWPSSGRPSIRPRSCPASSRCPQRGRTTSSPRCCGSTASATRSSTSGPTTSTAGATSSASRGRRGPHGDRVATYAEIGAGEIGLVIDSYGLLAVALDRRSAADELGLGPGDEVRSRRRRRRPRRRHHRCRWRSGSSAGRPVGSAPVRPATTLTIALLLVRARRRRRGSSSSCAERCVVERPPGRTASGRTPGWVASGAAAPAVGGRLALPEGGPPDAT